MASPLQSLIATGTKLWLDSIDPDLVRQNRAWGASGATSNPIIIADLIKTGRFDEPLKEHLRAGLSDGDIAWQLTDMLVRQAQQVFEPVWRETHGNDGYVSFELDPLLEDPERNLPVAERSRQYVELGKKWAAGHTNRMIKVPNTAGGLGALEELAAAGVQLNVTLTFTPRQYVAARDAVRRGLLRAKEPAQVKSVYSIFVSRVDVYTEKHVPLLSTRAQGLVGIYNAKKIWQMNRDYWADKGLSLQQELIFASTGVKNKSDKPSKYVEAFAGDGIETNPPATNDEVQASGMTFTRQVDLLPPREIGEEIENKVNWQKLEDVLMAEGIKKFADPQKALLALIATKRKELSAK
jgi:transaldolase